MNWQAIMKKIKVRITLRIWPGEKKLGRPKDKKVIKEGIMKEIRRE